MKNFIILGTLNALTTKICFKKYAEGHIKLGWSNRGGCMSFTNRYCADLLKLSNACWYTTLPSYVPPPIQLTKKYKSDTYPKYENYNAINVDKVCDIPCDYDGVMGVPISFFNKYCPEQFEIVGVTSSGSGNLPKGWDDLTKEFLDIYYSQNGYNRYYKEMGGKLPCYFDREGKAFIPYKRLLIRKRK